MKYILFFLCCFVFSTTKAQFLPNLALENATTNVGANLLDPSLADRSLVNTWPWRVSHGTPQVDIIQVGRPPLIPLTPKNAIKIGVTPLKYTNGTNGTEDCNDNANTAATACGLGAGDKTSEGVFYNYNFKQGKKYYLRFSYQTGRLASGESIDKCFIKLTNGLSEPNTGSANNQRCYKLAQQIGTITTGTNGWVEENVSLPGIVDICLIPDQNYSQIWISADTETKSLDSECAAFFYVYDLSLEACDPSLTFGETQVFVPRYTRAYNPIPPRIQSSGFVIFMPLNPGDTIKFLNYANNNNVWRIDAATFISMLSRSPSSGVTGNIDIQYGTVAEFKIADCDVNTVFDECPLFETWINITSDSRTSEGGQVFIPNAFNPISQYVQNKVWQPVFVYNYPYNGEKISYMVLDRLGEIVVGGVWDDACNPPPRDFVKWDGRFNGQAVGSGVFAYYIAIENCQGRKEFRGDVTLTYNSNMQEQPDLNTISLEPTATKGLSDKQEHQPTETNEALNNTEPTSAQPQVMVFPNPNNGLVNIQIESPSKAYDIQLFSADGKLVYAENSLFASFHQIDISHLPSGFYFLKVSSPIFNQSFKLSKQ